MVPWYGARAAGRYNFYRFGYHCPIKRGQLYPASIAQLHSYFRWTV